MAMNGCELVHISRKRLIAVSDPIVSVPALIKPWCVAAVTISFPAEVKLQRRYRHFTSVTRTTSRRGPLCRPSEDRSHENSLRFYARDGPSQPRPEEHT